MKLTLFLKLLIFGGSFWTWGLLSGRILPQWIDVGNNLFLYWTFFILMIVALVMFSRMITKSLGG